MRYIFFIRASCALSICLFSFCLGSLSAQDRPLSVLIIGGGPGGLAAAIEAKLQGCDVVLVEKRSAYIRPQWLILSNNSLRLLIQWGVDVSEISISHIENHGDIGLLRINDLQENLKARVQDLGVNIVHGEFRELKKELAVVAMPEKELMIFPYDVIVGADGAYSTLRKNLGLENTCLGTAFGAIAIIPSSVELPVNISPILKIKKGYTRKVTFPFTTFFFVQLPEQALKEDLVKALEEQEDISYATAIKENNAFVFTDIKIELKQAQAFSDRGKSAILIGDAAATASFLQGRGVNTAFMGAEIAGRFFKEVQTQKDEAFKRFNSNMQKITDEMIQDSAPLFEP